MSTQLLEVQGRVFLYGEDDHPDPWAEDAAAQLVVERTDVNEIRLGIQLASLDFDHATFYLTESEAVRLALMIGKVALDR